MVEEVVEWVERRRQSEGLTMIREERDDSSGKSRKSKSTKDRERFRPDPNVDKLLYLLHLLYIRILHRITLRQRQRAYVIWSHQ